MDYPEAIADIPRKLRKNGTDVFRDPEEPQKRKKLFHPSLRASRMTLLEAKLSLAPHGLLPNSLPEVQAEMEAMQHENGDDAYDEENEGGTAVAPGINRPARKAQNVLTKQGDMAPYANVKVNHHLDPHTLPANKHHIATPKSRRMIKVMSACGTPRDVMALIMNIDMDTLEKHYWYELRVSTHEINARVAHRLYSYALHAQGREAVAAMTFWLKTRGNAHVKKGEPLIWSERIEHTGPGGGPIQMQEVTDQDRARSILQILTMAVANGQEALLPGLTINGERQQVDEEEEGEGKKRERRQGALGW